MAATEDPTISRARGALWRWRAAQFGIGLAALTATIASAIGAKELQSRTAPVPAMAMLDSPRAGDTPEHPILLASIDHIDESSQSAMSDDPEASSTLAAIESLPDAPSIPALSPDQLRFAADPSVRWFNGRPARPARTMVMTVTGYSPDARSCGPYADGQTATLHSVHTNAMKLVAADPRLLPYGSMLSIPGYDDSQIVPVLDCGSAIKGHRLDLLFPTHEEAIKWGRKKIRVTLWQYADGRPAENPRKLR